MANESVIDLILLKLFDHESWEEHRQKLHVDYQETRLRRFTPHRIMLHRPHLQPPHHRPTFRDHRPQSNSIRQTFCSGIKVRLLPPMGPILVERQLSQATKTMVSRHDTWSSTRWCFLTGRSGQERCAGSTLRGQPLPIRSSLRLRSIHFLIYGSTSSEDTRVPSVQ